VKPQGSGDPACDGALAGAGGTVDGDDGNHEEVNSE
jgi:hypothetical protein